MRGHNKLDGSLFDRVVVCIDELDSYFVRPGRETVEND
jgi:hypothetical protein